jgi:hypothetical protein
MLSLAQAGQMGVDDRREGAFMAEVDLDLAEVLALLKQMRGVTVAQRLPTLLISPHDQRFIIGTIRFMDLRLKWYAPSAEVARRCSSSSCPRDCRLRFRVGCLMRFTVAGCRKKRGHAWR